MIKISSNTNVFAHMFSFLSDLDHHNLSMVCRDASRASGQPHAWPPFRGLIVDSRRYRADKGSEIAAVSKMAITELLLIGFLKDREKQPQLSLGHLLSKSNNTLTSLTVDCDMTITIQQWTDVLRYAPNLKQLKTQASMAALNLAKAIKSVESVHPTGLAHGAPFDRLQVLELQEVGSSTVELELLTRFCGPREYPLTGLKLTGYNDGTDEDLSNTRVICSLISKMPLKSLVIDDCTYPHHLEEKDKEAALFAGTLKDTLESLDLESIEMYPSLMMTNFKELKSLSFSNSFHRCISYREHRWLLGLSKLQKLHLPAWGLGHNLDSTLLRLVTLPSLTELDCGYHWDKLIERVKVKLGGSIPLTSTSIPGGCHLITGNNFKTLKLS